MAKTTITLPDIGEGVAEGEIIEWLKKPGDTVGQDEPVVIVMTDKATVELPAPHPGTLTKQYYKPGDKAPVHQPLYDLEVASAVDSGVPALPKTRHLADKPEAPGVTALPKTRHLADKPEASGVLALPKTRHLAKKLGVNLETVTPTGRHAEVTEVDVKRGAIPALPGDEERPIIGIRKLMQQKMALSKQTIPHFSYFEQVDATRLVQLRQNIRAACDSEGVHLTFMPLLIRALSLTAKRFPEINSSIQGSTLVVHRQQNIGIAITTPNGLIVPSLKNVQDLPLRDLIHAFDSLKKRALSNKLDPSEMKESTLTISNYGVLGGGGRWATPIINHPEVAILAVARIQKQPLVVNDSLAVRDTLNLSWSFDHRVIDGELAAEASHYYSTLIKNPATLL